MTDEKEGQGTKDEHNYQHEKSKTPSPQSEKVEGEKPSEERAGQNEDIQQKQEIPKEGGFWDITFTNAVMAAFTLGIFVTAMVYTVFSGKQLEVMRGQLQTMERSLKLAQRAWVGPTGVSMLNELRTNEPIVSRVILRNTGLTPALNVETTVHILSSNIPLERFDEEEAFKPIENPRRSGTLFPSPSIGVMIMDSTYSEFEVKEIVNERAWIYLFGITTYVDIFEEPRDTKFCFVYEPRRTKNFVPCDRYNYAK